MAYRSPQKSQADDKPAFLFVPKNQCKCLIIRRAPEEIRTPNLLIRSQMLYPVELRAQNQCLARFYLAKSGNDVKEL